MYFERLRRLTTIIHAYQEKTRNLEMVWLEPMPVPTRCRSEQYDYVVSLGKFEDEDGEVGEGTLAVFAKNPHHRLNLLDSRGFMVISAPFGSLEDLIVIFKTRIHEQCTGNAQEAIRIIKGLEPEEYVSENIVDRFNFLLNRQIATLFFLALRDAKARSLTAVETRLAYVENVTIYGT